MTVACPYCDRDAELVTGADVYPGRPDLHDCVWGPDRMRRDHAYRWLADRLGIDPSECHIAMMDIETCQRVVEVCAPCP